MATASEILAKLQQGQVPAAPITPEQEAAVVNEVTAQIMERASKMRRFYTTFANSGIEVMKAPGVCERFQFHGQMLETDDPDAIAYLEKIANKQGSGIFDNPAFLGLPDPEKQVMEEDVRNAAVTAVQKLLAAGIKP